MDFLLATDVASRGLDIPGIKTVINYDMPTTYQVYVHRCGRTARGSASGRAVSLVGENDRSILKLALKNGRDAVKHRVLPTQVLQKYEQSVEALAPALKEVYRLERDEKQFDQLEMQLTRAQNLVEHEDEIKSRPKRIWFQPDQQQPPPTKKQAIKSILSLILAKQEQEQKRKLKLEKMPRKKKRLFLARQEDKELIARQSVAASKAKKQAKEGKMTRIGGEVKKGVSKKKKKRAFGFAAEISK